MWGDTHGRALAVALPASSMVASYPRCNNGGGPLKQSRVGARHFTKVVHQSTTLQINKMKKRTPRKKKVWLALNLSPPSITARSSKPCRCLLCARQGFNGFKSFRTTLQDLTGLDQALSVALAHFGRDYGCSDRGRDKKWVMMGTRVHSHNHAK